MKQKLQAILKEFESDQTLVTDQNALNNLRLKYLGKKGQISLIMPMLKDVPNDQKREMGMLVNSVKTEIETKIASLQTSLENKKIEQQIASAKKIDITLPCKETVGSLHPITITQKELEDIFVSMGFVVEEGNEIETEYNNFISVNVPATHPARDMQDTFWLNNGELLKSHTSALQNTILKKYHGPLKAIFPGRCFRNEALDASHENTFFQMEGIIVDKNVTVGNLIYFMKQMLSKVYKKDVEVRLRPGYFPFTEPSFELDLKCPFCDGKGCSVCKNGGWIELCPCGMIHPNVLKMAGIDPDKYSGCAFGLGLSRLTMTASNISDVRNLNGCNLKLLKQFKLDI